jgi:branched-subunit amino acid transport protein
MNASLGLMIVMMALVTYVTRAPFLVWLGRRRLPGVVERCFVVMPIAILVALAVPPLLLEQGRFAGVLRPELIGAALAGWIARHTRNLLVPVVSAVVVVACLRGLMRLIGGPSG